MENTQPDYIALAMVIVLLGIVVVMVIRKWLSERAAAKGQGQAEPVESTPTAEAPGSAGRIQLNGVSPKTAAMVMAIVADQMGKPINELRFISIQEVEE